MGVKKLTEVCSPKQWKTISQTEMLPEGYPVYGANGIIGYYNEYNHENPTVLITCRGATCGTLNISKPFSYVNGNAMALDNVIEDVDEKYLENFHKRCQTISETAFCTDHNYWVVRDPITVCLV